MAHSFERFSPKKVAVTANENQPRSPVVLANAPQTSKILQDVVDCVHSLKTGFEEDGSPIDDNNQTLHRFCAKLEYLLQADMKEKKSLTGRKKDYWDYFCECLGPIKGVNDGIKYVKTTGDCKTALGKGRGFLRFCLVHHRLADSIQQCCVNGKVTSGWFHPKSIWLQHDKSSFLIGCLYDLNDLIFDLAPRGYDLDNSWPSFARKSEGQQSWSLSERARTMSISSLSSIGQDTPSKNDLSSTPNDMHDYDHIVQELAISENTRSDMRDKIEALQQQKGTFQQSLAESKGEMNMLETQLKELQKEHKDLQATHRDLEKSYDQLKMESAYKDKDGKTQENAFETKLIELQSQNEKHIEQIRHLEEDLQLAQENLQITSDERDRSSRSSQEQEKEIVNLKLELDSERLKLEETIQEFDERKTDLEAKIKLMEENQSEGGTREQTIKDELSQSRKALNELEKKVLTLNKGFHWLNTIQDGCQFEEIEELDASVSLILKDVSYYVGGLKSKVQTATEEKEEINQQYKTMSGDLSKHREEASVFREKVVTLEAFVAKLQENENSLKDRTLSLENDLSTQIELCNEKKEECNQKDKCFRDSKSEIGQLQDQIERMKETLSQKAREIDDVRNENSRFQNDLQKTNEFYNMATKGQSDLMERLSSQEQMIHQKSDKLEEALEREKKSIEEKNNSERQNEVLQSKLDLLSKRNEELEDDKTKLTAMTEQLSTDLNQNKDSITQLEYRNKDLMRQIQDSEREINAHNVTLNDKELSTKKLIEEHTLKLKECESALKTEKEKLESVLQELSDSRNENVRKSNDIRTLEQKCSMSETTITSLKEMETKLNEKYENTEKELNGKTLALLSLEKDMEMKLKEENSLKEEKDNLKCDLKSFQDQFYEKQSEVVLLQEKLASSHDELERTKEFYTKASKTETELSTRFSILENSLQDKDKRISELTQNEKSQAVEISKLMRDVEDANQSLENLQADMDYLRKGFEEKESQIDGLKLEMGNMVIEKETMTRKLSEAAQSEVEQNKTMLDVSERYDAVLLVKSELEQELRNVKSKESETETGNRQLEQKVFEMEQKQQNLNSTIDQMKVDFNTTVQEKERLEQKIEDLEITSEENHVKIEQLNAKIETVLKEKESTSAELFEKNKVLNSLQDDISKLRTEYDALSKEKFDLEEKNEELEISLQKIRDEYNAITAKYDHLYEEKLSLIDSLKKLEETESTHISEISKLEKIKSEFEEKNSSLSDELGQIQQSYSELEKQLADLEVQVEKLQDKDAENLASIENVKKELFTTQKTNHTQADDLRVMEERELNNIEEIKMLQQSIQNAELEKDNIHGNFSVKCVEMSELQAKYDDFQSENSCLVQEYDLLQQSFNDLKITEEVVRSKLSEMTSERDELSADLVGIKELLKSLEVQLHEASVEKESLLNSRDALSTEVELLQSKLADMVQSKTDTETAYETSCKENEMLSAQLVALKDDLYVKNKEIEKLAEELQEIEESNALKETVIVELKSENVCLQNDKNVSEGAIKDMRSQIEEGRSSFEMLENSLCEKNKSIDEQGLKLGHLEEIEKAHTDSIMKCKELQIEIDLLLKEKQDIMTLNEQKESELMMLINGFKQEKQEMLVQIESENKQTSELQLVCEENVQSVNALQTKIKELEEEKTVMTKDWELHQQQSIKTIEDISGEKTLLTNEITFLQGEKSNIENQFSELQEAYTALEAIKEEQENVNIESSDKLKTCENQIQDLQHQLESMLSSKEENDDKLEQSLTEIQLEKQKCKEAIEECGNAVEKLKITNTQLESASLEKQDLEQLIDKLNEETRDKDQQLIDLQEEMNKSKTEIDALTHNYTRLESIHSELEVEKKRYESEIEKLKDIGMDNDSLEGKLRDSQEEIETLSRQVEELKSEIKDKSNESETAVINIKTEMESFIGEISNLKEELLDKNNVVEELENQAEVYKVELKEQSELNASLTTEITEGKKEKEDLKEEMNRIIKENETEHNSLKEKIDMLQNNEEQLTAKITDLNESLQQVVTENKDMNIEFERKNLDFETQSKELDDVKTKLIDVETKLKDHENEQDQNVQDSEAEVDSLRQEIEALEFQLSSKQLEDEKLQTSAVEESEFSDMKDKLMEQETVIEQLQQEMGDLRRIAQNFKEQEIQLQNLELQMQNKDKENITLRESLNKLEDELSAQTSTSILVKSTLTDEKTRTEEIIKEKDAEINQLKEDLEEMKKKLVKLIREKDNLWQKTDRLSFQQKLQASERWMDNGKVTHCLGCNTEFSFTIRKHHCRLCGRIFCNNCSSNYVQTAHSSKKLRACTSCYVKYTTPLEDQDPNVELDVEQSIEIPKRKIMGQKSPISLNSSTNSDLDVSVNDSMISSTSQQLMYEPGPSAQQSFTSSQLNTSGSSVEVTAVGGNETDEDKLKDTTSATALSDEKGDNGDEDRFHLISDEEVMRSLSMSGDHETAMPDDPNMTCSMYINMEDLQSGIVNSQNETWIKPGKCYAVPVIIERSDALFGWEFTSYPKDVVFSVTYRANQYEKFSDSQVIVPLCKCDSHKQVTKGELTAKQPGVYTLIFDNTYSRLTSKRVNYTLLTSSDET